MSEQRPDPVEAAFVEFRGALADVQAHIARVAAEPVHTPEEREQLHQDALSGRLGPEMQEVANRVESGDTTWAEVFEGGSEYSDLMLPHLTEMETRYADQWRLILDVDPTFVPLVEDEQPGDGPGGRT